MVSPYGNAAGSPSSQTIVIDSKTYNLAVERGGRIAHSVQDTGEELKWERDFRNGTWGMGETAEQTDSGYLFTDNMDLTRYGLRLSPTITTISLNSLIPNSVPPMWFEETSAGETNTATSTTSTTITRTGAGWTVNQWTGYEVGVEGQTRVIASNTATTLTVSTAFSPAPSSTPVYTIFGMRFIYIEQKNSSSTVRLYKIRPYDDSVFRTMTFTPTDVGTPSNVDAMFPCRFNGNWFLYMSLASTTSVQAIKKLTTVSEVNSSDDTFNNHGTATTTRGGFLIDQTQGTPIMARITGQTLVSNVVTTNSTDPLTEANWANVGYVSETSDLVGSFSAHAGITLIGTTRNVFAFDPSGNSYPVLVSLARGFNAHGFGLFNFGSTSYFLAQSGVWEIKNISNVRNIAADKIPYFTQPPNIATPINLTYFEGTTRGEWVWVCYSRSDQVSTTSYIKSLRQKTHPRSGLPAIWDTIITRSVQVRAPYVDIDSKLWWAEPGQNRVAYIQLGLDGSPNSAARGNNSSTYECYLPDLDAISFGARNPEISMQLRYAQLVIENGVSAASWQLKCYRDSSTVESVGSAVTTGANNLNWTVGTNDTALRLRPRLTVTTSSSFSDTGTSTGSNTSTTLNDTSKNWTLNQWTGFNVTIVAGYGKGQTRAIASNTAGAGTSVLTLSSAWDIVPDATSRYLITADPRALRLTIYARSSDRVRAVIAVAEPRNLFETQKLLRKLKDAGPITVREPDTNESHTAYIKEVNLVWYQTDTGFSQGIEIQYERHAAAV